MTESSAKRASTRVSRIVKAERRAVYRAFLDPDAVVAWLSPDNMTGHVHAFDAREGGRFRMTLTYLDPEHSLDLEDNELGFDILPSLKGGNSYWFHAKAGIPSVGSCHDGLTSPEDHEKASEASPASLIFTALTKSAWAENPHRPQTNLACDLRFSADMCPHSGHSRLVFRGATGTSRPPCHSVLYSSWRRNSNEPHIPA